MSASATAPIPVVLYGRAGCHLCDEARAALETIAAGERSLELREVDIESDSRLHAAYLERIPVIEIEGEVVSELEPDLDRLHARLDTLRR